MNLLQTNFNRSICQFRQPGKIDIEGTVYTYETNKAIFNIAIISGQKYYQKNMAGYVIDTNEKIHAAIEKHYNI